MANGHLLIAFLLHLLVVSQCAMGWSWVAMALLLRRCATEEKIHTVARLGIALGQRTLG